MWSVAPEELNVYSYSCVDKVKAPKERNVEIPTKTLRSYGAGTFFESVSIDISSLRDFD